MTNERIEDLVDVLGELYARAENTLAVKNSVQMIRHADKPGEWFYFQNQNQLRYKRSITSDAKSLLRQINEASEKVLLLSYREVNKDAIEITESEIRVKSLTKDQEQAIADLKKSNAESVAALASKAFSTYVSQVQVVNSLSSPDTLYEEIKSHAATFVQEGMTVTYSNGTQMPWKSWMEMNVRTTVHQEVGKAQVASGAKAGIVFYMCDTFGDCAKDHADYQGKIYYNADATPTKEEQDYIDQHGLLSMQEVMEGDPYLTTRPNCRHNFHAVPSDSVIEGGAKEYEGDFTHGDYDERNYRLSQEQRKMERNVRSWKLKAEDTKQMMKGVKDPELQSKLDSQNAKVRYWQGQTRELVNDHPNVLQRQYDRENARIVVQDLGVRYDYKAVDGELKRRK